MKVVMVFFCALYICINFMSPSTPDIDTQRGIASQAKGKVSCRYSPADFSRPITGYGETIHKARHEASKQCLEIRLDNYEKNFKDFPSTAYGQKIIDSCVNIDCL